MSMRDYRNRIAKWLQDGDDNFVQHERDGSTSYYFGHNSYVNIRTLSGTCAGPLESHPARPSNSNSAVTISVDVDTKAATKQIATFDKQVAALEERLENLRAEIKEIRKYFATFGVVVKDTTVTVEAFTKALQKAHRLQG